MTSQCRSVGDTGGGLGRGKGRGQSGGTLHTPPSTSRGGNKWVNRTAWAKVIIDILGTHYGRLPCTVGQIVSCTRVPGPREQVRTEITVCKHWVAPTLPICTEEPSSHRALHSQWPGH